VPPAKPIRSDTGAVDDIISAAGKKGIKVVSVRDTEKQKPLRIVLRQENEKTKASQRLNYGNKKPRRISNRPLTVRDLGGGIEETSKGRHLRLS